MTELDWLPSALRARIARVATEPCATEPCAAGLSGAPPHRPAADGSRPRPRSSSKSRERWRRRRIRSASDRQRRRELVRRWAELGARSAGEAAQAAALEALAPGLPWEVWGWARGILTDCSVERRRAVEACVYRLPASQGRALLAARDEWGERWPLLVACALAMWRCSRAARRGARAHRIVEGYSRGALGALIRRPDGRRYSLSGLWGSAGPFLALQRMGIYRRHQPPSNVARWVGPARCSACRAPASAACGCHAPLHRWSLAQTRYQREMAGKALVSLARYDRRARAELARYAPWLVRRAAELAAEQAADELEEHAPPPAERIESTKPLAEPVAEPVAEGTGPPG